MYAKVAAAASSLLPELAEAALGWSCTLAQHADASHMGVVVGWSTLRDQECTT
jgi:hypothetical protein